MSQLIGDKVILREIEEKDLKALWQLIYGEEDTEWRKWNAPYFPFEHEDFKKYYDRLTKRLATTLPL